MKHDDFDEKLYKYFVENKEIPQKLKDTINNVNLQKEVSNSLNYEYTTNNAFFNTEKNKHTKTFYKIATIACCSVFAVTGIVGATYTISKIWKEPKKVDITEYIEKTKDEKTWHEPVNDEKIENTIINYLNILGIDNLSTTILEKGNNLPESDEEFYLLRTNEDYNKSLLIYTDIYAENVTYFVNNEFDKNLTYDEISQELAIEKAEEIFKELNIWNNNYELESCDNNSNIWTINYCRNKNRYDHYSISFAVQSNKVNVMNMYNSKNNDYSSAEKNISKEDAIKIVEEKEKQFSDIEFTITSCEESIEKMNTYIYKLENDINIINSVDDTMYKTDDVARNVWVVKVEHKKESDILEYQSTENYKKYANKYYYVDMETGEIIGGKAGFMK